MSAIKPGTLCVQIKAVHAPEEIGRQCVFLRYVELQLCTICGLHYYDAIVSDDISPTGDAYVRADWLLPLGGWTADDELRLGVQNELSRQA